MLKKKMEIVKKQRAEMEKITLERLQSDLAKKTPEEIQEGLCKKILKLLSNILEKEEKIEYDKMMRELNLDKK